MLGPCVRCDRTVSHSKAGNPFRHKRPGSPEWCEPTSDPTPTVETGTTEEETVNDTDQAKLDDAPGYPFRTMGTRCDDPACGCDDHPQKGPWFGAMYSGECASCFDRIEEGDRIRADGQGGYECENCGEDDEPLAYTDVVANGLPLPAPLADPNVPQVPAPDPWDDPTPAAEQKPDLNVSGQPKARYEWRGSVNMGYLVKDPGTGDFRRYAKGTVKGFTRVTTFVKAASDSKAINDWGKRNIVIGASRRADVLLRANGLTHETDRAALTQIVAELEEAAGAKVGSDLGTFLHEFTEQMDAGLKKSEHAPEQFRWSLWMYAQALADAGLEPVPGLIERTTMVKEFGGVVGTFDRVFYHRPSGTYLIGDLKTGKTMEYSMDETNTQMWLYAHGVNQSGVYDWNTDTWERPWVGLGVPSDRAAMTSVREDVGVIIHMPVQGEQAGTVTLVHADLAAGARHAELCHAIRSRHKSKVAPFTVPVAESAPAYQVGSWADLFNNAQSVEHASELWLSAKAEGVEPMELQRLVGIAQQRLRELGVKG